MQDELEAEAPGAFVLLGVNASGLESGNASFTEGRTLPLLQDVPAVGAWGAWRVTYRDVVVLDGQLVKRGAYNLTEHDLSVAANREALKQFLRDARR